MPDLHPPSPTQARDKRAWAIVRLILGLVQMVGALVSLMLLLLTGMNAWSLTAVVGLRRSTLQTSSPSSPGSNTSSTMRSGGDERTCANASSPDSTHAPQALSRSNGFLTVS